MKLPDAVGSCITLPLQFSLSSQRNIVSYYPSSIFEQEKKNTNENFFSPFPSNICLCRPFQLIYEWRAVLAIGNHLAITGWSEKPCNGQTTLHDFFLNELKKRATHPPRFSLQHLVTSFASICFACLPWTQVMGDDSAKKACQQQVSLMSKVTLNCKQLRFLCYFKVEKCLELKFRLT